MAGWIKIHRSVLDKAWFKYSDYVQVWLYLLAMAVFEEKEYLFDGKIVILKPGQFVTTRNEISAKCGVHRSKVERILSRFKNEQQIEQVSGARSRLISILNWEKYQDCEPIIKPKSSANRATSEPQVSANKELKNKEIRNSSREQPFEESIKLFIQYPPALHEAFFRYWSEKDKAGKMRWEKEKTWELSKRLATWYHRDEKKYGQLLNGKPPTGDYRENAERFYNG